MNDDLETAWRADCVARERPSFLGITIAAITIVLAWSFIDFRLAPEHAHAFLIARLISSGIGVSILAVLVRTRRLPMMRAVVAVQILVTGAVGAVITAQVAPGSFFVYVLGFSLLFWGASTIPWPTRYQLATSLPVLACYLILELAGGHQPRTDEIGAAFYLASIATIGMMTAFLRDRLQRRAFTTAFELGARNRELGATLTQLRDTQARLVVAEKQSALGRLLAGLSHEINNPINVLHNNLEPLSSYFDDLVGAVQTPATATVDVEFIRDDARDAFGAMATAVERMRTLHRELRAFVRGDAPNPVVGDLNEGIVTTVTMMRRTLSAKITLDLVLEPLPPFAFHPGPLNQVILNLIQNAVYAVGEHGTVTVRTRPLDHTVELSVTDDGPGVSAAARQHLFEPFFTTKDVGDGTGLGLATSYQIVEAHGGTIAYDATHAPGARFVVTLPARAT